MVNTIFQFGEDALDNEATIHIDISTLGGNLSTLVNGDSLDFRATNFSVPTMTVATYEQTYKGFTIERWKAGTSMTRELNITFRIDKYWNVYTFLKSWQSMISDLEGDGSYFPDLSDNNILRTTATIQQLARTSNEEGKLEETVVAPGWVFTGLWPKEIGNVDFDNTSDGSTKTLDVVFDFLTVSRGSDA